MRQTYQEFYSLIGAAIVILSSWSSTAAVGYITVMTSIALLWLWVSCPVFLLILNSSIIIILITHGSPSLSAISLRGDELPDKVWRLAQRHNDCRIVLCCMWCL